MPGWYERTRELRETGQLTMVGVIQEQHPDRCALFMQWKQMDFPILVDSLNLLKISVVPAYVLIDESGIVRKINPRGIDAVTDFLAKDFEKKKTLDDTDDQLTKVTADAIAAALAEDDPANTFTAKGDTAFRLAQLTKNAHDAARLLDLAINAFSVSIPSQGEEIEKNLGPTHFKLGVAYRARSESANAKPDDFQKAIDHWLAAREVDPNQYIWRRRLQQYGPQLDKPYPFYDWVEQARIDVTARGEKPVELKVEPRGSELATRSRVFTVANKNVVNPDKLGRITRDEGLIDYTTVIVPHTDARRVRGSSARVHVTFAPNPEKLGHWNNESRPMLVWIDAADGWDLSNRLLQFATDVAAISEEPRAFEFEVRPTPGAQQRTDTLSGYALYNVCEDIDGVCVYRRLDFAIPLNSLHQE